MIRKNNKLTYWLRSLMMMVEPRSLMMRRKKRLLADFERMNDAERKEIMARVDYYCSLPEGCCLPADAPTLADHRFFTKPKLTRHSVYFFDSYEYTRYFPQSLHWQIEEGDVSTEMTVPTVTKTRPVMKEASNNVLINMDKVRHFLFIDDPVRWEDKQGKVLFRGVIYSKENRRRFVEMYGDNPLCDLKDTDRNSTLPERFKTDKLMTLREHLDYRYIMSLEGNDVASNLKWVMSSNSIAVMPRPTCESWYMEGQLIPDYHYIEIAPDFSDLMEKIEYYEAHPEKAKEIIMHAHEWVDGFRSKDREHLVAILTMQKYLALTN